MDLVSSLALPIIVVTFMGIAAGELPGLKMNRTTIALVGAVLLVALQIIPPSAALEVIDPNTLVLLFAMMLVGVHLRMAGLFDWIGQSIIEHTHSSRRLLAYIVLISGFLAAFLLNDTVVVVFTPLVLEMTRVLRRNPLPYLIGLAAGANVGSAATITGNPQNILIGLSSQIPYAIFLAALGPVVLVGLIVVWLILICLYPSEFNQPWPMEVTNIEAEFNSPLVFKCLALMILMVVAFLAGIPIALTAITAAALLLVSRRIQPDKVLARVDWSLLVFFTSLFVISGALEYTHLFQRLFVMIEPVIGSSIGFLVIATAILSNLISNVPAVMLIRPMMSGLPDPHQAWLALAMSSTLAGNLTLLGSFANLIVVEIAQKQGVKLTFREYLKAGVPITIFTIIFGLAWLSIVT
jgi:Na+/H+ antiporter NhaD/arsenite permease-like protein